MSIVLAAASVFLEFYRVGLDYGSEVTLEFDGNFEIIKSNKLVENTKVSVVPYLRLSDERYRRIDEVYIRLSNYFECYDTSYSEYADCEDDFFADRPRWPKNFEQLQIIFNETPTKLYPSITCVSSLEYTNVQGNYEKQYYVTENCDEERYGPDAIHQRVSAEQLEELLPDGKILGEINYASAGLLGFGNPHVSRQVTNLLAKNLWKTRFIEDSRVRYWRTTHLLGGPGKYRELRGAEKWERNGLINTKKNSNNLGLAYIILFCIFWAICSRYRRHK